MSEQCHICGPVKHEAPTVICAPCAFSPAESRIPDQRDPTQGQVEAGFGLSPDPAVGSSGNVRGAAHIIEAQLFS